MVWTFVGIIVGSPVGTYVGTRESQNVGTFVYGGRGFGRWPLRGGWGHRKTRCRVPLAVFCFLNSCAPDICFFIRPLLFGMRFFGCKLRRGGKSFRPVPSLVAVVFFSSSPSSYSSSSSSCCCNCLLYHSRQCHPRLRPPGFSSFAAPCRTRCSVSERRSEKADRGSGAPPTRATSDAATKTKVGINGMKMYFIR